MCMTNSFSIPLIDCALIFEFLASLAESPKVSAQEVNAPLYCLQTELMY